MVTDIIIGTRNRLAMLQLTVEYIQQRTHTPYRLTIIDDASTDGSGVWAKAQGLVMYRHERQMGMHGNLSDVARLTASDPVICTDDDALCPLLEPDWLARLLQAMAERPQLWMLGLNNPADNRTGSRHPYSDDGTVIYSRHVGGQFLAIRRNVLEVTPGLFGERKAQRSPNKTQAKWVQAHGGTVGYLRDVYTYHYCANSLRRPGKSWDGIMVKPVNMETLEPPEELRQCRPQ